MSRLMTRRRSIPRIHSTLLLRTRQRSSLRETSKRWWEPGGLSREREADVFGGDGAVFNGPALPAALVLLPGGRPGGGWGPAKGLPRQCWRVASKEFRWGFEGITERFRCSSPCLPIPQPTPYRRLHGSSGYASFILRGRRLAPAQTRSGGLSGAVTVWAPRTTRENTGKPRGCRPG